MPEQSQATGRTLLVQIAQERGCSLRTAATIVRQESHKREAADRMAVEVACHCDWGNCVDIPLEIRDLATEIQNKGSRAVPNRYRNRVVSNLPHSLQVARD